MDHPLLRLTQNVVQGDQFRVEIALELPRQPRQTAPTTFTFALTDQDQADLRWYLEDFLQYPQDPAPTIAARIEQRMAEIGKQLFGDVFQSRDALKLWARFQTSLPEARIEVATGIREATAIPWELLRDPDTDTPLALRARSFVRTHTEPAQPAASPQSTSGPVRILLVICRPGAGDDVPFRSVASRIVKGLSDEAREALLDVLRPPTFAQLAHVLRQAKTDGKPYHIVHFDGHGMCLETKEGGLPAEIRKRLSALLLSSPREGSHAYLAFENPAVEENMQLVDGPALGGLLAEVGVPLLVLNACRSAHAEAAPTPEQDGSPDTHAQVRAFGSLAQEVMDAGVTGVVAMRYNVYVVTAAQFVADLYTSLAHGQSLGEAVSMGRKQLAAQPLREIAYDPRPLQDWPVPVVYEAAPLMIFPPSKDKKFTITLRNAAAAPQRGDQIDLPPPPDTGFWGRDENILAIDRAFDAHHVVLLHAYAGSGKTVTAAEFARWYSLTGGVAGPVLFTSFEHYRPLPRVLDLIGRVFGPFLEQQAGIHWLALDDPQRRKVGIQVLQQIPVLWIWDNVEPVAGFPTSTASAWKPQEQQELADFLRAARNTKARFLLTSRRDERPWLGNLPTRITLPPMPMQERVQLARALAAKQNKTLTAVDDWRPLLRFTGGNPLTLTVDLGQALREGFTTKEQIEAFVAALRTGETTFEDEATEGRTKSLGASLSYGFATAFTDTERRQLALLYLFQGFVDVDVLCGMGRLESNTGEDYSLPIIHGLTSEAATSLLDRAAQIGLLAALGGGHYSIHPALPWFFKGLFDQFYPQILTPAKHEEGVQRLAANDQLSAIRAFCESMGALGNWCHRMYDEGNPNIINTLRAEEANLLQARRIARLQQWWGVVLSVTRGLEKLYGHTGRRSEWATLVDEIVPDFVDPGTDGPLPEREDEWGLLTGYRVRLLVEALEWGEAERLQRICVEWDRRRAAAALAASSDTLDDAARAAIRTLATSLEYLGTIQRGQGNADCVALYHEAMKLAQRAADGHEEAVLAFNLGHTYIQVPSLCDLAQAEQWYRRSLQLFAESDRHSRAKCLGQLGFVAFEHFLKASRDSRPRDELLRYLDAAYQSYHHALALLPLDAVNDLAVTHNELGNVYLAAGDINRALNHWREALRCMDMAGDRYQAGLARFNIAVALHLAERSVDALTYAEAALRNYKTYGDLATDKIRKANELIGEIKQAIASQKGGGSKP